ncbi:hypothetical protein GcM1_157010, partial [Golovinomyces cichoracearum]
MSNANNMRCPGEVENGSDHRDVGHARIGHQLHSIRLLFFSKIPSCHGSRPNEHFKEPGKLGEETSRNKKENSQGSAGVLDDRC